MAKQLSMLDDVPALAQEDEDGTTFTATEVIRRRLAYDAWQLDFLRRFYDERREAIMQSGNPVRIRLLNEHDEPERKHQWKPAVD
jgi:hypothetical protein